MVDPPSGRAGIGRSLRRLTRHLPDPVRAAIRGRLRPSAPAAAAPKNVAGKALRPPELTVVVAAQDAADHLDDCLAALRAQTLTRIEVLVVLVDPAGGTAEVARRGVATDDRFALVDGVHSHRPAAWNAGAREARGEHLAFIEATDIPPPAAYSTLVGSLRSTGSDFAAGGLREVRLGRPRPPAWAVATHDLDRTGRTLAEFSDAMFDIGLVNRVFRADFWRRAVRGFAEESDHSESYAVVTATVAAARFDYLKRVVMVRQPPAASATARTGGADLAGLDDQLHWLEAALTVADDRATPAVAARLLGRFIDTELGDLATAAVQAGTDDQELLRQTAARLLVRADRDTWPYVRVGRKLRLWHAAHGQWPEIVRTDDHFRLVGATPRTRVDPALPEPRIVVVGLPDPGPGALPPAPGCDELGVVETGLSGCIERLRWDGTVLTVEGWAFIRGVDLAGVTPELSAQLSEIESQATFPVRVDVQPRPAANRWARLRHHDVAPGGFVLTVETADLPTAPGRWQLGLTIRAVGVTRVGLLQQAVAAGAAGRGAARPVAAVDDPVAMVARIDREHGFCIQVRTDVARAEGLTIDGSTVSARVLDLRATRPIAAVRLTSSAGREVQAPCDEDGRFVLEVPTDHPGSWVLRAEDDRGRRHRVAWPVESADSRPTTSGRGPHWVRTPRGFAEVVTGPIHEALDVSVDADVLGVVVRDDPGTDWTSARLVAPSAEVSVSKVSVVAAGLQLQFPLHARRWGGPDLPLPSGDYELRLGSEPPMVGADELLARFPVEQLTASHVVQVGRGAGRALQISLAGPRTVAERSSYGREQLSIAYAAATPVPTDSVLFQCYRGEFATDSQAAIHDELHSRGRDLELLWGVYDLSVPLPEGGRALLIESEAWFEALANSRFLCPNIDYERYFIHRPHQRYLQTFHGYPFKSMGASLWRTHGRPEAVIATEQRRRSSAWDAILVPADFCVELYRREYGYAGDALVTGYPRNDALVTADGPVVRRRVLETLGIPPEKTVVLYAPTWRDRTATSSWTAAIFDELDLERLAEQLGEDYAVLLRGHNYNLREGFDLADGRFTDVTSYPEVNDLILAADVAVLDYSSMRFDWALTGKPMLFFVPDLDDYLKTRTVLFDYPATAPGPMLATTDAVAAALLDLDAVAAEYAAARTAFNERFNALHDGQAGRRVVDAFFVDEH